MIEEEILDMRNRNHAQEQFFFEEPDMEALQKILDQQFAIIELSRRKKRREEPQIAIILDDLSADTRFIRNNKRLHVLYTRGRHAKITTVTSAHKANIVAPIVRAQATAARMPLFGCSFSGSCDRSTRSIASAPSVSAARFSSSRPVGSA